MATLITFEDCLLGALEIVVVVALNLPLMLLPLSIIAGLAMHVTWKYLKVRHMNFDGVAVLPLY